MKEYIVRVYENRTEWYNKEGELHREGGPAVEWNDGDKEWWLNGARHRENGHAFERDGVKEWWVNGKLHREDGSAVEYSNGNKEWWLNGKEYTEEEFNKRVKSFNGKIVEIDGKKYKLMEV